MAYIPWGDHRGGRLELFLLAPCLAPSANLSAARPEPDGGCVTIEAREFHLPVQKIPEFTGTLYEAAGQPAPIILPRPPELGTASIFPGGYSVQRDPGAVTILVGSEERSLTPDEARDYAAAIAARADEADAGKAGTEALAELLHACRDCCIGGPSETDRQQARAILRAGYKPPEATP